ncbi:MAG: ABC transporter permease [Roseiflexaceae bacterium]
MKHRHLIDIVAIPMLLLLIVPLIGLGSRSSLTDLWQALASQELQQAVTVTAQTSIIAILCVIIGGTPLAVWLNRNPLSRWRTLLVDLPAVLPPAVAGLALLTIFGRTGWLGPTLTAFGWQIPFTPLAVVLAQTFVAAPLYIRSASAALQGIEPDVLNAARVDGASRYELWRYVIVPLAMPGLQAGVAMALARALGEFGATALFAGSMPGQTRTLALAIYINADYDSATAIAMSLILLMSAVVLLLIVKRVNTTT